MNKFILGSVFATLIAVFSGCHGYDYDHGKWFPHPGGGHHGNGNHHGHHKCKKGKKCKHKGHGHGHGRSAEMLAQDYDIAPASAEAFVALANDGSDRARVISDLGVSAAEIRPLAELEMPAPETIARIAERLGEEPFKVERLVSDFIADARQEADQQPH